MRDRKAVRALRGDAHGRRSRCLLGAFAKRRICLLRTRSNYQIREVENMTLVQDKGAYAKYTDVTGKLYIPLVYFNGAKRPLKKTNGSKKNAKTARR